ncbi:alpha/beta hydrolase [Massilia endophytica]|uniref:hypothetical protein n=1 Tax=Massilia endophytica TaxID=2899220 RepID=UPI001E4045B0|nr:hypothetical protein [Massilia endophytica]UGQ46627.1 hypothetical protein LSQ66_23145 [Massilia endophytica]
MMERRTVLAFAAALAVGAYRIAPEAKAAGSGYAVGQLRTEWMENMRRHTAVVYYPARDGGVHEAARRYPFLVFAPGMSKLAGDYSVLLEMLAAQGFVVAAVRAAKPARNHNQSEYLTMTQDILAMARRMQALARDRNSPLGGRINVKGYAAFGHSLGGAASALAADYDSSIVAAMNLDGDYSDNTLDARPRQPLGYLVTEPPAGGGWMERWSHSKSEHRREGIWKDVSSKSAAPCRLRVRGMLHANFEDGAIHPELNKNRPYGSIDGQRGIAMTAALVKAFFLPYLKDDAASAKAELAAVMADYPEIAFMP